MYYSLVKKCMFPNSQWNHVTVHMRFLLSIYSVIRQSLVRMVTVNQSLTVYKNRDNRDVVQEEVDEVTAKMSNKVILYQTNKEGRLITEVWKRQYKFIKKHKQLGLHKKVISRYKRKLKGEILATFIKKINDGRWKNDFKNTKRQEPVENRDGQCSLTRHMMIHYY